MVIAATLFDNGTAAGAAATVLGVVVSALTLSSRRERDFQASNWQAARRMEMTRLQFGRRAEPGRLYHLVHLLTLDPSVGADQRAHRRRVERLAARARMAAALRPDVHASGLACSLHWAECVGQFASETAGDHRIRITPFLQTNHLALLREGALAAPFLLGSGRIPDQSAIALDNEVVWALALVDVARRYHLATPWQRRAVGFANEPDAGAVVLPPSRLRSTWSFLTAESRRLRLRPRHYRRTARFLIAAEGLLSETTHDPEPNRGNGE